MSAELLKEFLGLVATGRALNAAQAERAFEIIMSGEATPAQIGAFLMALRVRGESVDEIVGAARIMRAKALRIEAPPDAIDTCGTGGDASGTFNISTATALVVAGCGVPVAKHGNRALSSKSGSADVLAALGVKIDAEMALVQEALWTARIGFLMAPRHHSAMRFVAGPRAELGIRTIFNLLGPLSNPAGAKRQLIGVFAHEWVEPLARVLGALGAEKAWVVHGSDGLDEITTTGATFIAEWDGSRVRSFEIRPEEAGLALADPRSLKGGDVATNSAALRRLLDGEKGPYRDIVALNAAAALVVAGRARDLAQGVNLAEASIDSGLAAAALRRLVEITNRPPLVEAAS